MYKIVFDNQTDYHVVETTTFQKVNVVVKGKLFNNDTFDENETVVHSPVRLDKYIPGVLDLTRTYGKDGKFLYLCKPDDKRLPFFIIPYTIPVTFLKNTKHLYVTFEYIDWTRENPRGSITQNLGCVDIPEHFYEYMLYCKSLNISIQSFTKDANREIKAHNIIDSIIHNYSIPIRKDNVFTIDAPGSVDLDDAISIRDNVLSVYITHVPIIMDYLNLWSSFTNRISTIYLPDKKRSMLPNSLSQLCSLNEGQLRICLVMDYNIDTTEYEFGLCGVKIKKNYTYSDDIQDKDFKEISSKLHVKKSNELITKIMILFNTNSASQMKQHKNGIYKNVKNHQYDFMKNQATGYELYSDNVNYLHITSPIRRLIDILNLYQITINLDLFHFTDEAFFYNKWISRLDYMNLCCKNIRKVQNQCSLLSMFENKKHQVYKGYVYDKIARTDNKYKYQVHIYDLNIVYDLTVLEDLVECTDHMFKLYVFHDEAKLKKKVKLQLVESIVV